MAQIEEGIPPDARNVFESHLFSFNQEKITIKASSIGYQSK
jgi:hypothetical protein